MKLKPKQAWRIYFKKRELHKTKLCFITWLDSRLPNRFCWTDCVGWAFDPMAFNPFKLRRPVGCKLDDHCYCGRYVFGEKFKSEPATRNPQPATK